MAYSDGASVGLKIVFAAQICPGAARGRNQISSIGGWPRTFSRQLSALSFLTSSLILVVSLCKTSLQNAKKS